MKIIKLLVLAAVLCLISTTQILADPLYDFVDVVAGLISPVYNNVTTIKDVLQQRGTIFKVAAVVGNSVSITSYLAVVSGLPIYGFIKGAKAIIAKIKEKRAQKPAVEETVATQEEATTTQA
jgi:hypothetical protein